MSSFDDEMPTVILTNRIRVANFSSPHSFRFTDGKELPACSDARSRRLMLHAEERETPKFVYPRVNGQQDFTAAPKEWTDIQIQFHLSDPVREALDQAWEQVKLEGIDVVIVPRPVLEALRRENKTLYSHFLRTVRMADRVNKINHNDRFCC